MTPQEAAAELRAWSPTGGGLADADEQGRLLRGHLAQLAAHPGADGGWAGSALDRAGPPEHLTASALVLDAAGASALLLRHRRAGLWLQPGGHVEAADASLLAAARREAAEETGLGALLHPALGGRPVDLHRHALGAGFTRCREHLDVAFLLVADPGPDGAPPPPVVSAESDGAAWWPLGALPQDAAPDLPPRLARAAALLAAGRARCAYRSSSESVGSAPSSTSPSGRSRAAAKPSR